MLFLATPWTFDPGQLSGLRPSANVLILITVAFSMWLIVSVRLLRFLWVLHRHTSVATGMVWMSAALVVITSCRALRLIQIWRNATSNAAVLSLPWFVAFVTLLWVPVYLFHGLEQLSRPRPDSSQSFRRWEKVAAAVAALFSCLIIGSLLMGHHSVELVLLLIALLTEVLLALAVLFKLRQPGVLSRSQIVFVLFSAGGLALLCCPAALLLFSVFTVMPVFFFRVIIETGMMLIVLGAFLVFSSLRFADVLLKDVLRTYWWGIILLGTWFGLQAILQLPHFAGVISVTERGLFAVGFLLLGMVALPWGERFINQAVSDWLFDQPDYAQLASSLWRNLQTSDDPAIWFSEVAATLCKGSGFAAANIVELNQHSPQAEAFAAHKEDAIFPRAGDPLRSLTEPPAELLLPLRFHGDAVYALAVSRGPLQGSILRSELDFLRRIVRQVEARLEAGRLANTRREREQHEERLRAQITEAELRALRAQVQPHFLFNSLNTIAHLTIAAPELAERMTTMLASIFRYVLTSTEDTLVPLEQEVRFIEDYLAIEQMRFGRRLTTEILVDEKVRAMLVPPLLLQPLVENALLHGLAPKIEGGLLRLTARSEQQRFCIHVEDTGVGLAASSGKRSGGTNVGLANIRKRLECHYGPSATLTVAERQEGGVCATVQIPIVGNR
jgi:two-component system, LytTR family, sensor kinase